MLLGDNNKNVLREKFKINNSEITQENKVGGLKKKNKIKKNKKPNLDDIYTVEYMNLDDNTYENEKRLLKSIPLDKEISTYLPNISDIIETKYNKEKKEYIYDINLQKGFPGGKQKIKLVIYQINNFNTLPFLSYLLYKYNETEDSEEHLTLPELETDNIKIKSKNIVNSIFENYNEKPKYRGYKIFKNEFYLFFEYSPTKEDIIENLKRDNRWFWTVVYELINIKKVLNFPINRQTVDFFLNNFDITNIYLKDNLNTYETPIIAYHGSHYKKINFISILGISRASPNASLGPFYYFAPYDNAVRYAMFSPNNKHTTVGNETITIDDEGRYEKGGLVRFVIFTGKTKIFDEEEDFIKKSVITKLKEAIINWSENYNSCFTGLYNKIIDKKPITIYSKFVVKQYEQQKPLSYHYIETNIKEKNFEKIKIE